MTVTSDVLTLRSFAKDAASASLSTESTVTPPRDSVDLTGNVTLVMATSATSTPSVFASAFLMESFSAAPTCFKPFREMEVATRGLSAAILGSARYQGASFVKTIRAFVHSFNVRGASLKCARGPVRFRYHWS